MDTDNLKFAERLRTIAEAIENGEVSAVHITTVAEGTGDFFSAELGHQLVLDAMATHHTRLRVCHGPTDEASH